MEIVKREGFKVIGIKIRTTNENKQAATDIGALWKKFFSENMAAKIPNKINDSIFSIYTNYETDHTKPYDTILGCKVSTLNDIPHGMMGQEFEAANYAKFKAHGNLKEGVVYQAWLDIWKYPLNRTYTADYEVYGEKAQNPKNAELDIFVAVN